MKPWTINDRRNSLIELPARIVLTIYKRLLAKLPVALEREPLVRLPGAASLFFAFAVGGRPVPQYVFSSNHFLGRREK